MGRGVWRRALATATCVGMAAIAAPAAAGPPSENHFEGTEVYCYGEAGERTVELGANFSPAGEIQAGFGWVYDETSAVQVVMATGAHQSGAFAVSYEFVDDQGEPAGTLDLSGTTMPAGDPQDISERFRDGNTQIRASGTVADLMAAGDITAGTGALADLPGTPLTCMGFEVDVTEWMTNPATRIFRSAGSTGSCAIGEDGMLNVDVWGEQAYGQLALGIDWEAQTADLIAEGMLTYQDPSITGELAVVEPPGTDDVVMVDLTVGEVIERDRYRGKWSNGAFFQRNVLRELSGTAVLPGGEVLMLTDCVFSDWISMDRFSSRAGQKPGGRPPVNDLPGDALAIAPAGTAQASTRGAAAAAEAPCVEVRDGKPSEVPFGRTVWYTFDGTSEEVTLSTAGSGFDTVMGVYDADGLGQVACVDDVLAEDGGDLEAWVTLPTVAGTTYLVQVGGFGYVEDPFGPLWGDVVLNRS